MLEQNELIVAVLSNPYLIHAEECRRDFFTFVQAFWGEIIHEEPVYNWHIPYLCTQLQKVAERVIAGKPKKNDMCINIPPGTTKSTICTVMFPAWVWIMRNPEDMTKTGAFARFITGSFNKELSTEHSELCRDVIRSDKYKKYFPELQLRKDKDAKTNYKNTAGGTRFTTSVGSGATGRHSHFILIDDPVDPNQALSDADRETANRWLDHVLSTRKVDKRVTVTVLIMQRLHKVDPTGHWLSKVKKRVKHIVLPGALEFDGTVFEIKPKKLAKFYVNGLLDPERLDAVVLDDMKTDLGSYGFSGQVGQDPRDREGGMFQRQYIEIVKEAPAGGTKWVRGWDLAATSEAESKSKKIGAAYTAGVKMKWCDGIFYIGDVERKRVSNPRNIMKNTASQDEKGTIIDFPQDPGSAGKIQARDLASHLADYVVKFGLESGDKILRLEPFSAQWEAENVKLVEGAWNTDYLDEGEYFPNGFKDQFDASGRAFNRLRRIVKKMNSNSIGAPAGTKNTNKINPEQHKRAA